MRTKIDTIQKDLKKRITAHIKKANVLLAAAIMFDLIPQIMLAYVILALSSEPADGWLLAQAAGMTGAYAYKVDASLYLCIP